MKISLITVGRMKRGPERELVDDYIVRAKKLGTSLGVRDVSEIEVEAGHTQDQECERLLAKIPAGAQVFLFERFLSESGLVSNFVLAMLTASAAVPPATV